MAVVAMEVTESSWALKANVIFDLSNILTILSSKPPIIKLFKLTILITVITHNYLLVDTWPCIDIFI